MITLDNSTTPLSSRPALPSRVIAGAGFFSSPKSSLIPSLLQNKPLERNIAKVISSCRGSGFEAVESKIRPILVDPGSASQQPSSPAYRPFGTKNYPVVLFQTSARGGKEVYPDGSRPLHRPCAVVLSQPYQPELRTYPQRRKTASINRSPKSPVTPLSRTEQVARQMGGLSQAQPQEEAIPSPHHAIRQAVPLGQSFPLRQVTPPHRLTHRRFHP